MKTHNKNTSNETGFVQAGFIFYASQKRSLIYYLILNLAIGGNWGGEVDDTIFPCEMQIDYVRIYEK